MFPLLRPKRATLSFCILILNTFVSPTGSCLFQYPSFPSQTLCYNACSDSRQRLVLKFSSSQLARPVSGGDLVYPTLFRGRLRITALGWVPDNSDKPRPPLGGKYHQPTTQAFVDHPWLSVEASQLSNLIQNLSFGSFFLLHLLCTSDHPHLVLLQLASHFHPPFPVTSRLQPCPRLTPPSSPQLALSPYR